MVDEFGQADVIGLSLRNERAQLPDIREHRRRSHQRQEKMARVRLLLFQLNEKSQEISDVHRRADQLIVAADPPITPEYKDDVRKALVDALADTSKHLDSLITDEQKYISELLNLHTAENRLIKRVEEFRSYIDSKVLWTRSAPRLAPGDFWRSGAAVGPGAGLQWLGRLVRLCGGLRVDNGSGDLAAACGGCRHMLQRRSRREVLPLAHRGAAA